MPEETSSNHSPSARLRALASAGALLVLLGVYLRASPSTPAAPTSSEEPEFDAARQRMVDVGITHWGINNQAVLNALRTVPRHRFVPAEYLDQAYEDHPLPIGFGQTISQPFIVALMTQELELEPGDRVLEIGTGSGYQAAILAELDVEVYTVEVIRELGDSAADRLADLGYADVQVRVADGYNGWPEHAPYDAIIVTAAPDHVPQPLLSQLSDGARIVIPVGPAGGYQELWKIRRVGEDFEMHSLGGVRFVPLVHEE